MTQFTDDRLDALLRAADAADPALTPEQTARQATLLASLTGTTSTTDSAVVQPLSSARFRRRLVRWGLPAAAAAALATVLVVSETPGGTGRAYASWTPKPTPITGGTLTTAEQACRDWMRDDLERMKRDVPADQLSTADADTARTVIAERRGSFLFLGMVMADGSTQQCFFSADHPDTVDAASGGWATKDSTQRILTGSQLEGNASGLSSGSEGTYAFTVGRVGPDVRAVTLRTEGLTIQASLAQGHFATWWPTKVTQGSGPAIAYDVTLTDGTVLQDVTPAS